MESGSRETVGRDAARPPGFAARLVTVAQRLFHDGFAGLGKAGCDRRLKLVETLHLGGKRQLMLIQCDGQLVLVGAGTDSIQSILEIRHQSLTSVQRSDGSPRSKRADAIECTGQQAVCQ